MDKNRNISLNKNRTMSQSVGSAYSISGWVKGDYGAKVVYKRYPVKELQD